MLSHEAAAFSHERRQLAQIIGVALTQEEQRRWQLWFAGVGAIVGFMLFPSIAILGSFAGGGEKLR